MKLELATLRRRRKQKNRTHSAPRDDKPLPQQVRQLREHYGRVAAVAARLEGRTAPTPGLAYKIKLTATMLRLGMTRRQAVDHLLRELSETRRRGAEREQ